MLGRWFARAFVCVWVLTPGCTPGCAKDRPKEASPPTEAASAQLQPRVGNQVGGIEDQPDYDLQARTLRRQVANRLPRPLLEPAVACHNMLAAATAAYARRDGGQARAVAVLSSTQSGDQHRCEAETSPAAAACVTVLLADNNPLPTGEFPWLLDQCSRAFPR